jgi:hypothetical protein
MKSIRLWVVTAWQRIFPPVETRMRSLVSSDLVAARAQLHDRLSTLDARMARALNGK